MQKKRNVQYRGITNAIRRGIASGRINGEITVPAVRAEMDASKASASNKVVEKSMKYLAKQKEIHTDGFRFFTTSPKSSETKNVTVHGKLVSTKTIEGGKMVAEIVVDSLNYN